MEKQTAMQELIKEMESLKTNKPYVNPQNALRDCISLAYLKLGMEKEQMIQFGESVCQDGFEEWVEDEFNKKYGKK
jgi:hypothetical protein